MYEKGLVSVIVPCYNVKKYLGKCLKSISNQTYGKLEILLIDDGSTDGTSALCDIFSGVDKRIRVFHKKNGGVSSARNVGIQNAKGEYIMFVDPDDTIDDYMVENLFSSAKNTRSDIVCCGYKRKYLFFKKIEEIKYKKNVILDNNFIVKNMIRNIVLPKGENICPFCVYSKLIKTSLIKENAILFNEEWNHAEDFEFIIRVFLKTQSMVFINSTPYNYMKHIGAKSLTSNHFKPNWFEQRVRYRKFVDEIAKSVFGINADERNTPEAIVKYAHEEGTKIIKCVKEHRQCIDQLERIFNNSDYLLAVEQCDFQNLEDILKFEVISAREKNFEKWSRYIEKISAT